MLTIYQFLLRIASVHYIVEHCPSCNTSVGQVAVIDEPTEDMNLFDTLKDYRMTQRSTNPHVCSCGTKLVPRTSN
jgi:hypothetical protein